MHYSSFLVAIFVALCYVNTASAGPLGVECECMCCLPNKNDDSCTLKDIGFVHLSDAVCNITQCIQQCKTAYPLCERASGKVESGCSDT